MCDFLITASPSFRGADLLHMMKLPYGPASPEGYDFDFPWGSMAVLEDHFSPSNVRLEGNIVLAWIGDLECRMSDQYVRSLIKTMSSFRRNEQFSLESDPVLGQLNGAFTILAADPLGFFIITDPRSFSTVFASNDSTGAGVFGSHCDTVAALAGNSNNIDETHVAEFLNFGAVCFPNTIYSNVKRLEPATIFSFTIAGNGKMQTSRGTYWKTPDELQTYKEQDLVEELRNSLVLAVKERCHNGKLAVTLSGGLDSRLILSVVPREMDCVTLTFCDFENREARTARAIARKCQRPWIPLVRHKEFIGDNLLQTIKFTGCEGMFVYAHMIGFADQVNALGIDSILGGTQMDTYLKGYYARDMVRASGLPWSWPHNFEKIPVDFVHSLTDLWQQNFSKHVTERVYEARQSFFNRYFDPRRSSTAEWLSLNPIDTMFVSWRGERRVLPSRLIVLDRRLLEFSFKCPVHLKLGNYIYLKAAGPLFGPSASVPTSDKGILPNAGSFSNFGRRIRRKCGEAMSNLIARSRHVQHSWHDYQSYWQNSAVLRDLIAQHSNQLSRFDGSLFKDTGQSILYRPDIRWDHGFRLVQFAVWLGTIPQYQKCVNFLRSSPQAPKSDRSQIP
jgi:hypothetical protein